MMALSVTWKGYADSSGVRFEDFFNDDHTIVARFMPQYPHAYDGPLVANVGGGVYFLGQGDFQYVTLGSKMIVRVADQTQYFDAPLAVARWFHVALARQGDNFTFFFNGVADLKTFSVSMPNNYLPSGTLRLGRKEAQGTVRQFFGFIDDVAIFDKALSESEVKALSDALHLTGNEANLKYGWTFGGSALPATVSPPVSLTGAAKQEVLTTDRNTTLDYLKLPLPSVQKKMVLPFKSGEAWSVVQGYDDKLSSHNGYASFSWDFIVAGTEDGTEYPNGTGGAPFYACAAGKVVDVKQNYPSGDANPGNVVQIEQAPEEICHILHMRQNTAEVQVGDMVKPSQLLGLMGDSGVPVGHNHMHIAVSNDLDQTPGFVTFPIAFSNYEVQKLDGTWEPVALGIPKVLEIVRNPLVPRVDAPKDVDPFPKWWLWPIIAIRFIIRLTVMVVRAIINIILYLIRSVTRR